MSAVSDNFDADSFVSYAPSASPTPWPDAAPAAQTMANAQPEIKMGTIDSNRPVEGTCPHCKTVIKTNIKKEEDKWVAEKMWLLLIVCFCFFSYESECAPCPECACGKPCCPCCLHLTTYHYCPQCEKEIGFHRTGCTKCLAGNSVPFQAAPKRKSSW